MAAPTLREAAATLAAAFHDGALFTHVEPDPRRRAERLPWLFEGILRYCRRRGAIEQVEDAAAVAGWVPGARFAPTPADLVRTGLVGAPTRLGPVATLRLERHERPTEPRLRAAMTPTTAYLWVLGARPERHGQGLGARAVSATLAAMARAGYDRCLLRTDDAPNVALYQHLGFELVEDLAPLPSGLPSWILARPTRP